MNADGSGKTNLTKDSTFWASDPAWSPDGAKIAFYGVDFSAGQESGDIWVMNADGSGKKNLTNADASDAAPAWSPDGTEIAFASRDGEIWVMDADGGNRRDISNNPANEDGPAWSPDGTKIAFWRAPRGVHSDLYVMDADGSRQTNLTNSSESEGSPTWSPDGRKIVFETDRGPDGDSQIFAMNPDGTGQTRLTKGDDDEPDWQVRPAGPPPRICRVPRVIGRSLRAARARIRRANCSVGRIRHSRSATARGRVVRQSPRPGIRLYRGAPVSLTASRGSL